MKKFILHISVLLTCISAGAQDFLTKGRIEFEVKVNTKRMFEEMFKGKEDRMMMMGGGEGPEFYVTKKELLFNGDRTLYRRTGTDNFMGGGSITIFSDIENGKARFKGSAMTNDNIFEDSVTRLRWKIDDETRVIAGFKCRKAVGVMMDSIYVVAFYCPEIVPQGGPEIFAGLPGMILGVAIPRMYTTWFATKVQLEVDEKQIVAPAPGKKEKIHSIAEARELYRQEVGSFLRAGVHNDEIDLTMKGLGGSGIFRRQ